MLHWQNPTNFMAVRVHYNTGQVRLFRVEDGALTAVATGSNASLTHNAEYSAKILIDDDTGTPALQRLRVWIDLDQDESFDDETALLTTIAIDDTWDGGRFGFFRQSGSDAHTQKYDDLVTMVVSDGEAHVNHRTDDAVASA